MANSPSQSAVPEAALQFAEALVNSIEYASWDEELASYWQEKLLILARIHQVPHSFLSELMKDCTVPALLKLFKDEVTDQVVGNASTSLKMALGAALQDVNPFKGVLAYTAPHNERVFWKAQTSALMRTVALYRLQSRELLAGLMAISLTTLHGAKVSDAALLENGLPDKEPSYW